MSKVAITGNASGTGTLTIAAPNTNTDRTLTLPDEAGTVLTSGGAIDVSASAPADSVVIDSSGNLLVGKTALNTNTTGLQLESDGYLSACRDGGNVALINRKTSDGAIVTFQKNGTTVGSIGVKERTSQGRIFIGNSNTRLLFDNGVDAIIPANNDGNDRDNALDLGQLAARFDDIYATNGTIQTSDANEKQDIEALSEAEARVAVAAKGLLRKFRWRDAVTEKGDDARIHFGIIAQDLQAAFAAEGLDAGRYAMFISSTWWEATETYTDDDGVEQTRTNTYETQEEAPQGATQRTRLGVRYPELLAFIIAAI